MSKKRVQEVTLCRDCRHSKAVTTEYLNHDGEPIFCTCDLVKHYHFLNHDVIHRNCIYYEQR